MLPAAGSAQARTAQAQAEPRQAAAPVSRPSRRERLREKQAAEQERAALRNRLAELHRQMQRTESAKGHAADALAASEKAISEANRALAELDAEQAEADQHLAALQQQRKQLERLIAQRRQQLAQLARDQYLAGGTDRSRLLLSGENPNRISRDLHYLDYVARAQAQLVARLDADLAQVAENTREVEETRAELERIEEEQQRQKSLLEKEKSKRATLLAGISTKLEAQRQQAGNLRRDEARLASLVDQLAKIIEEQRRAEAEREAARKELARKEAARRQQARKEAAARREAFREEQRRLAQAQGKPAPRETFKAEPIDDDPPPSAQAEPAAAAVAPAVELDKLRGQLRLPVKGEVVARYGSKRGEGNSWKGLFIRAAEGAPVHSLAAGKVVFADWLRGFGNIVIVDHGNQYMSIYGNNQAVLKRPGDAVRAGELIANAGNSGGNEFSGLYFEVRFQGRPVDPMPWMAKR